MFSSPTYLDAEHKWDQSNAAKALSDLIVGAGSPWVAPHALRRTLARAGGAPLHPIANQVGHSNLVMTGGVLLGRDFMRARQPVAALVD
jgi:integrase